MHKQQNSIYNMFLSIQLHFKNHVTAWNTNIPIVNTIEKFNICIEALNETFMLQSGNNTGIALDKKTIREHLETQAHILSSGATAYATFDQLPELVLKTKYTLSVLKRLRDAELQSIATNLATNVEPVLPALAPYGITPDTIARLRATIHLFAANINKPKESSELKKKATAKMVVLIKEASLLLKTQLDLLIVGLQSTEPSFVSLYTSLRRIRKPNRTKLGLTTEVIDALTLLPIVGAQLELLNSKTKRVTSLKGKNIIKHISEGRHELKVSHKDYLEVVEKFITVKGITNNLIIKLEAAN